MMESHKATSKLTGGALVKQEPVITEVDKFREPTFKTKIHGI